MLLEVAFAQNNHTDGRDQNKNTDDLERQIVIVEKQETDVADIVDCRSCQRGKTLFGRAELADNVKNLGKESERDGDASSRGQPVNAAQFFRAQIEQHDDEEKQHHDRTGVDQDLDNADEIGLERHKESSETEKRNDKTKRTRHWIAIDDDGHAEDQHQERKDPEQVSGHYQLRSAECGLRIVTHRPDLISDF